MADGLNDLYVHDRQERDMTDFDGSGKGSGHYTKNWEFRENLRSASIFIMLDVIFFLLFLLSASMYGKELYIKSTWNKIVIDDATISSQGITGEYEGKICSFSGEVPSSSETVTKDITVYYQDEVTKGTVYLSDSFYYIAILLTVGGVVLMTWKATRVMKKTKHSEGVQRQGKFDD